MRAEPRGRKNERKKGDENESFSSPHARSPQTLSSRVLPVIPTPSRHTRLARPSSALPGCESSASSLPTPPDRCYDMNECPHRAKNLLPGKETTCCLMIGRTSHTASSTMGQRNAHPSPAPLSAPPPLSSPAPRVSPPLRPKNPRVVLSPQGPKAANATRFVCVSDTHSRTHDVRQRFLFFESASLRSSVSPLYFVRHPLVLSRCPVVTQRCSGSCSLSLPP